MLKSLVKYFVKINIKKIEVIRDPIAPEIVFLGLILVNLGPLKIFPNTKPPTSDATHVNKIMKINIFRCKKEERIKKYVQKVKI